MSAATAVEIPPRRSTLYEIASDRADLVAIIDQLDYEDHAEALDVLMGQLDALDIELPHKVEKLCRFLRNMEAQHEALSGEIKRLAARREVQMHKVDRLKRYLHDCLSIAGLWKLAVGIFNVSIRTNSGNQPRDRERLERELAVQLAEPALKSTCIAGVSIRTQYSLVIVDAELPDEYKLERGEHVQVR